MAGLMDVPGLAGYFQTQEHLRRGEASQMGQLQGLLGIQQAMQRQQMEAQMQPLKIAQLQAQAQKAQAEQQRATDYQSEISALGPNPDQAALAGVAARFSSPDKLMDVQTRSLDRQAQQEASLVAARERIAANIEAAKQRGADQRQIAEMQMAGRRDLMQLAASLRQPPQPRQLQLTADAQGNQLIVNPDGTATPLTMGGAGVKKPVGTEKPMTEFQGKSSLYGTRAAQSDKVLRNLEGKINLEGLASKQAASNVPVIGGVLGYIGNQWLSDDQQRVEQAQRDFVNAVLRQESGAVINPSEFENAKKQYFPAPGDNKAVIEQKRLNREIAISGFARMAGPGAEDIRSLQAERLLPSLGNRAGAPRQPGPTRDVRSEADKILGL